MLLREMMSDPFLEHYGVVVIDQAHERTVSTDTLLGLLKDILLQRPQLRVVVLTVTSMADKLLSHYGNIPLISLEASSAAEVVHSNGGNKDYFYSALRLVLEIHRTKEDGDVLVFLASAEVRDVVLSGLFWRDLRLISLFWPALFEMFSTGGSLCPQHPQERRYQVGNRAGPNGACGPVSWWTRLTACLYRATGLQEAQEGFPLYPRGRRCVVVYRDRALCHRHRSPEKDGRLFRRNYLKHLLEMRSVKIFCM